MKSIIFNMYESPFFRFISFFSRRRQTSRREQRHRPWTWVPLPHSNHTQTHSLSLSVCASLPLFSPLAPHPYPHPNPTPSSYVCKRSHGNCRTVCLATGFILSLEKKRGAERGGCVCGEGRGGCMGAWMWVRMIVERQHVAVDPLKQTPFLPSPHLQQLPLPCSLSVSPQAFFTSLSACFTNQIYSNPVFVFRHFRGL